MAQPGVFIVFWVSVHPTLSVVNYYKFIKIYLHKKYIKYLINLPIFCYMTFKKQGKIGVNIHLIYTQ